eukprot:snap_masked-scaffold_3-processed-gene-17.5-mRNA-1 protein AED:1.00 eAED:1.00 QI:0/-1/0/0/-1/1/1/0/390
MSKLKRSSYTLRQKQKLYIDFIKSGQNQSTFAKEHGIPRNTFKGFIKQCKKLDLCAIPAILRHAELDKKKNVRRSTISEQVELDLFSWFQEQRTKFLEVSYQDVVTKCIELDPSFESSSEKAIYMRVKRFCKRHNIIYKNKVERPQIVFNEDDEKKSVLFALKQQIDTLDVPDKRVIYLKEHKVYFHRLCDKFLKVEDNEKHPKKIESVSVKLILGTVKTGTKLRPIVLLDPQVFVDLKMDGTIESSEDSLLQMTSSGPFLSKSVFISWFANVLLPYLKDTESKKTGDPSILLVEKSSTYMSSRVLNMLNKNNVFLKFLPTSNGEDAEFEQNRISVYLNKKIGENQAQVKDIKQENDVDTKPSNILNIIQAAWSNLEKDFVIEEWETLLG